MSPRGRPIEGSFRYRHAVEVRYGDTDAMGHVNNAVVEARVAWASRSSFGLEYRVLSEWGPVAAARLLAAIEAFEGHPIPARPEAG